MTQRLLTKQLIQKLHTVLGPKYTILDMTHKVTNSENRISIFHELIGVAELDPSIIYIIRHNSILNGELCHWFNADWLLIHKTGICRPTTYMSINDALWLVYYMITRRCGGICPVCNTKSDTLTYDNSNRYIFPGGIYVDDNYIIQYMYPTLAICKHCSK